MSVKRSMIEIVPGNAFAGETEEMTIRDFSCPYCFGRGYYIHETGKDEHETVECKACKGEKKLKAYVQIAWLPDGN